AGQASSGARSVLSESQARLAFLDRNTRYLHIQSEPEQEALPIPTSFLLLTCSVPDTSAASCDSCRRDGMNLKRKVADWLNCEQARGPICACKMNAKLTSSIKKEQPAKQQPCARALLAQ